MLKQGVGGLTSHEMGLLFQQDPAFSAQVVRKSIFQVNWLRKVFDLLIIQANPLNSDTDLMCQDEFEEMSGKARSKHHNLPLLLLTDEIDGRKKQMIALAVSSGFTFSSHLSKRCQTLKAFFSHLLMLLARGWVGVQD